MDSIFGLGEVERAVFLRHMMHSLGSSYICLWSYSPLPSNCLKFLDGVYKEESNVQQQASSSSGSFGRRLFDSYCGTLNYLDLGYVPGFAFKNKLPYMEMNLDTISSHSQMQLHFYHGAGIKTLVFMGCAVGEIELGFLSAPQVNVEMEMRKWFPMDFSRQLTLINPTSSSSINSSSIECSIEIDCSCSPSCLFDDIHDNPSTTLLVRSNPMLQIQETTHGVMAPTTIISLLSSPPTSSSCSQIDMPPIGQARAAFTRYRAAPVRAPAHKHTYSLFRRAVLFYRHLNTRQTQEQGNAQTHHVVQERRRREKLNDSFQLLRTLLPQLPKKDKASVLSKTTEYLASLKSQVEQLKHRNHILEMQLSTTTTTQREMGSDQNDQSERVYVKIEGVSGGGESRLVDLRVGLRSRECKLIDLVSEVLNMFKHYQTNLSLLCLQSNTRQQSITPLHALIFRLKLEGNDFDERGFEEAVRRVVQKLPH